MKVGLQDTIHLSGALGIWDTELYREGKKMEQLTFWNFIGILGAAATLIALGIAFGNGISGRTVAYLRQQNSAIEDEKKRLEKQVASLEQALAVETPARAKPVSHEAPVESQDSIEVRLNRGETAQLFGGDLFLTFLSSSFEGTPLRYRTTAIVGRHKKSNATIENVDAGYRTEYQGYEIRVLKSEGYVSEFLVRRLAENAG